MLLRNLAAVVSTVLIISCAHAPVVEKPTDVTKHPTTYETLNGIYDALMHVRDTTPHNALIQISQDSKAKLEKLIYDSWTTSADDINTALALLISQKRDNDIIWKESLFLLVSSPRFLDKAVHLAESDAYVYERQQHILRDPNKGIWISNKAEIILNVKTIRLPFGSVQTSVNSWWRMVSRPTE